MRLVCLLNRTKNLRQSEGLFYQRFPSEKRSGGIAHSGPLCYTESEIPAALRAVRHTAAFRTQRRRKKEGKYIRAAKRHIELGTARHPTARISKPYPRKGTETTVPQILLLRRASAFQNHIPVRGRKLAPTRRLTLSATSFQNHIPVRGRKHVEGYKFVGDAPNFKTISP